MKPDGAGPPKGGSDRRLEKAARREVKDGERRSKATRRRRETDQRELAVFVHVPKTAGTSLVQVLRANDPGACLRIANVFKGGGGAAPDPDFSYPRLIELARAHPRARVLHGHVPLGVDEFMPEHWERRYITLLRDPVDRALSHYYHEEMPTLTAGLPYERALSDLALVPDNLQTRMLCGSPTPFGPVSRDMLEQAKRNLETRFALVGLSDRFDESLVLLKRRLGFRTILQDDKRINRQRPDRSSAPDELVAAARAANPCDVELYEFASALFDRAPELDELDFQIELEAFRRARSGTTVATSSLPDGFPGDGEAWALLLRARIDVLEHARDFGNALIRSAEETADLQYELRVISRQIDKRALRKKRKALERKALVFERQLQRGQGTNNQAPE